MDLDAELLALAGGDSSGDESNLSPPKHKSSSPQEHSEPRSPTADMTGKGVAKRTKRVRRRKHDSDDDEPTP